MAANGQRPTTNTTNDDLYYSHAEIISARVRAPKSVSFSSRTVYRGPVFSVTTDHVEEPNGVRARRDVIHHSGSIVVLAVDDSSRHSPHPARTPISSRRQPSYLWELPAGRIDPGEKELAAAKARTARRNRIHRRPLEAHPQVLCQPRLCRRNDGGIPGATGLRPGKAQPEEDEIIHIHMVPLPKAVNMVLRGTIQDAKTISSVLWLDRQFDHQFNHQPRAKASK